MKLRVSSTLNTMDVINLSRDMMPFVRIQLKEGRTALQKEILSEELSIRCFYKFRRKRQYYVLIDN